MEVDYLIVGQGIAGSILSYELIKRGKKIIVINDSRVNFSSKAAAGIFNPITGRKMVKTWKSDTLFPYLNQFYPELEIFLEEKFFHPTSIYRPFLSVEEQNEWMGKSSSPEFQALIKVCHTKGRYDHYINDKYGGMELNACGYVNIMTLLKALKKYLIDKNLYIEEVFDGTKVNNDTPFIRYNDIVARKIIFCDGPSASASKYFSWLPFRLVKGELLLIKTREEIPVIFNRGVFILPIGDGICKVGATYEWNDLSWVTTEKGKNGLKKKLDNIFKLNYSIIDQIAGIRPATLDRRPFIGHHPEVGNVAVFNGFGTKGVSLIPYFANTFVNCLEKNKELDKEVNINRYFSLY